MNKNHTDSRMLALDGLRGLMCLLVVWQHFGLSNLKENVFVPSAVKWIFWLLGNQGGLGVFFFFTLAGFLMTKLYFPVKNYTDFYLKRLSRIFPLFLAMSFILGVDKYFQPSTALLIIIAIASLFISNIIWHIFFSIPISNRVRLFVFFIIFSGTLGIYAYYLRQNVDVFNGASTLIKFLVTVLVNGTATFGFGDYIPVLGLVFWSMGAEMLFYLAYPVLPILFAKIKNDARHNLLFISLLFGGYLLITWIGKNFLSFNFYHPETSIYFFLGFYLCMRLYWGNLSTILLGRGKMQNIFFILFCGGVIFANAYSSVWGHWLLNDMSRVWLNFFLVSEVFALLLQNRESFLLRFFSSKLFLFLGSISYSLYLVHSLIIDRIGGITSLDNTITLFWKFVILTTTSVFFAKIIYELNEKRYFTFYKDQISKYSIQKISVLRKIRLSKILIYLILFLLIVFVNRPRASLFSLEKTAVIQSSISSETVISAQTPIEISFHSVHEGLNYFTLLLDYNGNILDYNQAQKTPQKSQIRVDLYDKNSSQEGPLASFWRESYRLSSEKITKISFPLQIDSKNKDYLAKINLIDPKEGEVIRIYPSSSTKLGHNLNKKSTLKSVSNLLELFTYQVSHFLYSWVFWGQIIGVSVWLYSFERLKKSQT